MDYSCLKEEGPWAGIYGTSTERRKRDKEEFLQDITTETQKRTESP